MNLSEAHKKKSQIFSAVTRQDIEELRSLLSSPEWYTVENESGFNLLQHTIIETNQKVFDFLLSINSFPLDATSSKKTTALITCLTSSDEYYALELIKKGANVHSIDDEGNTLLHLAVQRVFTQSCQLLLEKGLDVNAENNEGQTPFEILPLIIHSHQVIAIIYILLYYNADVFPPGNRCFGIHIFEKFLTTRDCLFVEILFNYAIDEYSNYEIDSYTLFRFMTWFPNCDLFYKIMNKTRDVIENDLPYCASHLFLIDNNNMKLLLEKCDYLIKNTLKCCVDIYHPFYFNSESFANFAVLLESRVSDDTIELANYLGISGIIKGFKESDCCSSTIKDLIYYILPYLSTISCEGMNLVYRQFGYSDLFKTLLHMNIDIDNSIYDIMPGIIFDVNFDLGKYLDYHIFSIDDPYGDGFPEEEGYETGCSLGGVDKFLNYFADPRVKNFCYKQDIERLVTKAKKLPQVPLLQELARESCRKFLVQKYNVTTSGQFYTILDRLPIGNTHKKIISYETPLYHV